MTTGKPSFKWVFNFNITKPPKNLIRNEVAEHPLKPLTVSVNDCRIARRIGGSTTSSTDSSTPSRTPTQIVLDPLGSALDGTDPLSQFAKQELDSLSESGFDGWEKVNNRKKNEDSECESNVESWAVLKSAILSKFTTSEKLSMVTSFLSGGEKVVVKTQSSAVDKVKNRLEQLDDFEEGSVRQMLDLTQQEYISRIELLNQELVQAWNQDQRVKALKIVIQCSKLLVDVSVIQFYPSKFVLITDILDIFGKLVYDRLRAKAECIQPKNNLKTLPDNFTPDMVPESAKETCRNWFYKIASIRELVPRLYCEMSILKSYSFLDSMQYSQALMRLSRMIRGIGDPLVAIYARCYLCRVGMNITNSRNREFMKENFYDFLSCYKQLTNPVVKAELARQNMEFPIYLTLYTPALDWILQGVANNASESLLEEILQKCQSTCKSALLLNTIMAAFKPAYIASRALQFIQLVSSCDDQGLPQYLLYRTLGLCLSLADSPLEQRPQILNDVWKEVSKLEKPLEYISCAEVWITFIVKNFRKREINIFLNDIIKHVSPNRAYENYYPQLQTIINKIVQETSDFENLFAMDKFLPLLDLFQKESIKVEACKTIMNKFSKTQLEPFNDPVLTNALMFICRVMHDSVSALTVEDEKRQIGNLICCFIRKVEFGRDFEQQLSFYVEARASFTSLDAVNTLLVQSVNRLAVETRKVVKGHHTRKTASFVRACAAYCFITIPSITSVFTKLELYLLSGQVALLNQCLGQADASFKAALNLIPDLPKTIEIDGKQKCSEQYLISFLCNFLSTLIVVPDNPEQGVLYLTRGLVNVVQSYTWENNSNGKAIIYLHVLDMLHAVVQEVYPYHIEKVDSNDTLYGSDPKFLSEVNKMSSVILDEILAHLKLLGVREQYKKQSVLAFDLFLRVVLLTDLNQPGLSDLALNLWVLIHKNGCFDNKLVIRDIDNQDHFIIDEKLSRCDSRCMQLCKAVTMSTKIFNNFLCKNLKNPKHIHLYPSHRTAEKNPIFTRFGDNGKSKIYGGDLSKDHVIFEAIGVTEELNAYVGLAREYVLEDEKLGPLAEKLRRIQLVLIDTLEIVSGLHPQDLDVDKVKGVDTPSTSKITKGDIADLESLVNHYDTLLPPAEKFVVPGGGKASATLHVARAVCRRCERILVKIFKDIETEKNLLAYINRLSSYLFQAARITAKFANRTESIYRAPLKGDLNPTATQQTPTQQ